MREIRLQVHTEPPGRFTLGPGVNRVGRDPGNAVWIDHPSVSGCHCALIVQPDGAILVRDMGSTNGTYLDGEAVTAAPLGPGQVLTVGEVSMHLEPPPGPAPGTSAGPRSLAPREVVARRPAAAPAGSTGAASSPAPAFVALLPGAFRYAWQGDAWILLFGAAGLSLLLDLVPGPFGVLGWILGFWVAAYFFSLFREVFHSTIHGEDRLPSSPDVSYAWEDVRELLVRWLVPQLVAFAPLMVAEWIPGTPVGVKVVLAAFGCFYAPMALLGVLVSDSLVAVSPWFVGRSILRAPLDYTVLAVLLGLPFLVERIPGLLPGGTVGGRAIGLAVSAVMTLVLVYLALVWVRLLGLFYRCHRERLGWVLETRDTEIPL